VSVPASRDAGASKRRRLLILGGTGEAAALAQFVCEKFGDRIRVTTSLAGRTERPAAVAGELRVGGFGGAPALAAYLREQEFDFVIDATHPFAARISAAARLACAESGVPRLTLARPPWRAGPGDRWIEVADAEAAAKLLPQLGRRAFLTLGRRDLAAFSRSQGCWYLVRLVEAPKEAPPLGEPGRDYELVIARGPFTEEGERELMRRHRIDVLVAKASGGEATRAKLIAARELGLPAVLLRRPELEPGERAESLEDALGWLDRALAGLDGASAVPM
jgi:precorrin-6A/cobalt-precorrin-6A reductase